ncbi:tandem-95 repeat protein [candidate division KSB1 bacterium]|nr:tandem-95 repeat protein [candidate division KSB1 bacterium]
MTAFDGPWDNGIYPEWYENLSVTDRTDLQRAALNINRLDDFPPDGGLIVDPCPTRVGRLRFTILQPGQPINISWNTTYCAITDYSGYVTIKSYFIFSSDPPTLCKDFGDIPETYLTSSAYHEINGLITPTLYLGSVIPDDEVSPATPLDGTGDDNTDTDDEECTAIPALTENQQTTLNVGFTKPSGTAYLMAWFDWDDNGTFEAGERIANITLTTQTSPIPVSVTPPIGSAGDTYARFRISSSSALTQATGEVDGEVEDFPVTINAAQEFDFGDAATGYPVTLAEDGARHVAGTLRLGTALTDTEIDGTHSANADHDDLNGTTPDDEDGVLLMGADANGQTLYRNTTYAFQVSASAAGFLYAWINLDGAAGWQNNATDYIAQGVPVSAGANWVVFTVPTTAPLGQTYARFRLSSVQITTPLPTGLWDDGEVEDYVFTIEAEQTTWDYGDALVPASPRHHTYPGRSMGSNGLDEEATAYASATAEGDDTQGSVPDDEEGVTTAGWQGTLPVTVIRSATTQITVNAAIVGYLNMWVDLNGDDTFDAGEWVANDQLLNAGSNTITFNTLGTVNNARGHNFVRLRFCTAPGVATNPTASGDNPAAMDGECEDYSVTFADPTQYDFGDAPTSYGTNTASHVIPADPVLYLGSVVPDAEGSPSPPLDGTGDDVTGTPDDEEGVTLPTRVVQGTVANWTISFTKPVGTTAYLRGWFDWDGNGSFEAGELMVDEVLTTQTSPLVVGVACPGGATIGASYARFRLSSTSDMTAVGACTDGEVEDYAMTIEASDQEPRDFGDIPSTYGTPTAWHIVPSASVYLGTVPPDAEAGPNTPLDGSGDDITGSPDDEDGVAVPVLSCTGDNNFVVSYAKPAGREVYIRGWIDWNCDGDFTSGPGVYDQDELAVDVTIPSASGSGTQTFNIPVSPAAGNGGQSFVRFRISSVRMSGGLLPDFGYDDGEVEDYAIDIPDCQQQNHPPEAINDINDTQMNIPVNGNVLTNDSDPDGDPIAVSQIITLPTNGGLTWNPDGSYTYTPNTGFVGEDFFVYEVCDNGVPPLCDQATVTIEVTFDDPANNPPVANDDAAETFMNTPVTVVVMANDFDPDGDAITVTAITQPPAGEGSAVLNGNGTITYTPPSGFTGETSFTYTLCDNGTPQLCDVGTVTVYVHEDPAGNDPPFAMDDAVVTHIDQPVSGDMSLNDYDPNGDPLTYNTTPVSGPSHGNVVINSDGTFTYTPNTGYVGPDNFVYEVCDNAVPPACDQATVYIVVLDEPTQVEYDYGALGLLPDARQRIDAQAGPFIGTAPDAELSSNDLSESDGLSFSNTDPNQACQLDVDVLNNSAPGAPAYLSAWLDLNDNSIIEVGEMLGSVQTVPASPAPQTVTFNFTTPNGAIGDTYWLRFIISTSVNDAGIPGNALSENYGEVQDYLLELTPVELTSFTAVAVNGMVRLEWRTQSETDNLGFHVFRSESETGNYTQITRSMIPGAGSSTVEHRYTYDDQDIEPDKQYYYKLADIEYSGRMTLHGPISVKTTSPTDYILEQNYPNPFNPDTRITFSMKESGFVRLSIYNLKGQLVRQLLSRHLQVGSHTEVWDGKDNNGKILPSGTYLYKLQVNGVEIVRKMEFLK